MNKKNVDDISYMKIEIIKIRFKKCNHLEILKCIFNYPCVKYDI